MLYIYIAIYGLICLILFAAGILVSLDLKNDYRKYAGIKRKAKKRIKVSKTQNLKNKRNYRCNYIKK